MDYSKTAVRHHQSDDEFIDEMLQGTSRTFALAIPLLAEERRRQIGLSYLLFRVADSIEDAPECDVTLKKDLLTALKNSLSVSVPDSSLHSESAGSDTLSFGGLWPAHSATERLLLEYPRLRAIFAELPHAISLATGNALTSTIQGMIRFIDASANSPNQIHIQTIGDLRLYCYAVAGIVGELLTDTFVFHHPPGLADHKELRQRSTGFGEFLQLINILKDSAVDATSGRIFIPVEASRESICELVRSARSDALMYIRLLEKTDFPADIRSFCRFLYFLADASFNKLLHGGAGSKLTRGEVMQIFSGIRDESGIMPVT